MLARYTLAGHSSNQTMTSAKSGAQTLSKHDRDALPTRNKRHFFYRAQVPALAENDRQTVVGAVHRLVEENGLGIAQIEVFTAKQLREVSETTAESFERICTSLGLDLVKDKPGIVVCEWASPP